MQDILMKNKKITLIMPYYDNGGMLEVQQRIWMKYSNDIINKISFIIVDDGSPVNKASEHIIQDYLDLSIYYVTVDIPWNQDHARNLGSYKADTEWLILTDMDHIIPEETISYLLNNIKVFDDKYYYTFDRINYKDNSDYKYHPNSYFISKKLYWEIGGYDEEFAGYYGTDGLFRKRMDIVSRGKIHLDGFKIIRCGREDIPDASTRTLHRKDGRNLSLGKKIHDRFNYKLKNKIPPKTLSFPYIKEYPI